MTVHRPRVMKQAGVWLVDCPCSEPQPVLSWRVGIDYARAHVALLADDKSLAWQPRRTP